METLSASFSAIADLLQLPEARETNQQQLVAAALRWLATHKEWLLIFDNVEDLSLLKAYVPAARQGAVLITTRLHTLEGLAQPLELSAFSRAEALRFLLRRAQLADAALPLDEVPREVLRTASALVKAMGGLPLALDQAGAYIERTGCSLADYLRLFQRYRGRLLAERSLAADHPQSVVQTFFLSFAKIEQANAAAADLLRLCAFLHPDAIPEELFTRGAAHLGPLLATTASDPYLFNQALGEVLQYSLLARQPQSQTLSLHRLVQAVLKTMMDETTHRLWATRTIEALATCGSLITEDRLWSDYARVLPHAQYAVHLIQELRMVSPQAGHILAHAGRYLQDHGQYAEAEPLYQRALRIREQAQGPEHPDMAIPLNNLASLYVEQGRYAEAEPLFQRALHIWEQQLGPDHPYVAHPLTGLAGLYQAQERYAQAEPLYLRALSIREHALEPHHPDTAETLHGLATLREMQGNPQEAASLYQRTLAIREQVLGPQHPQTGETRERLRAVLVALEREQEAAELDLVQPESAET